MSSDGAALAARVKNTRTPSVDEKYDALQNKFIDLLGDRNDYRNRSLNAELTLRCVEKLVLAWQQKADAGLPDPTWHTCAEDLLAVLLDGT